MKRHKHPHCSCRKLERDPRCQFHNKLDALLKLPEPKSEFVKDTIALMREHENGRVFHRNPFTVEEILEQRAAKSKGKPHKPLVHNPFAKLRGMRE